MQGPPAASKRDVEEAEQKAKEAKAKATEEAERVHEQLREEIEEVREENRELRRIIGVLDLRQMEILENAKHKSLGKAFGVEETARERVESDDDQEESDDA